MSHIQENGDFLRLKAFWPWPSRLLALSLTLSILHAFQNPLAVASIKAERCQEGNQAKCSVKSLLGEGEVFGALSASNPFP